LIPYFTLVAILFYLRFAVAFFHKHDTHKEKEK